MQISRDALNLPVSLSLSLSLSHRFCRMRVHFRALASDPLVRSFSSRGRQSASGFTRGWVSADAKILSARVNRLPRRAEGAESGKRKAESGRRMKAARKVDSTPWILTPRISSAAKRTKVPSVPEKQPLLSLFLPSYSLSLSFSLYYPRLGRKVVAVVAFLSLLNRCNVDARSISRILE
jgi:hypothetical protein